MENVSTRTAEEQEIINEWLREPTFQEILESGREDYRISGMGKQEIFERTTAVFDYATGEETTLKFCRDKYGKEIAQALLDNKLGRKELEPKIKQQIEDIHRGNLPVERKKKEKEEVKAPSTAEKSAKKNNGKVKFIGTPFVLIDNPAFRKTFKGMYLTYIYIRRYIIRGKLRFDPLNIYEEYFLKNVLASCWSIGGLAKALGTSPNTIRKHIRKLKETGCIEVVKVQAKKAWDNQRHNIYVLGTYTIDNNGLRNEKFYIDEAFNQPADKAK